MTQPQQQTRFSLHYGKKYSINHIWFVLVAFTLDRYNICDAQQSRLALIPGVNIYCMIHINSMLRERDCYLDTMPCHAFISCMFLVSFMYASTFSNLACRINNRINSMFIFFYLYRGAIAPTLWTDSINTKVRCHSLISNIISNIIFHFLTEIH